jgi:hypothetical protein
MIRERRAGIASTISPLEAELMLALSLSVDAEGETASSSEQ